MSSEASLGKILQDWLLQAGWQVYPEVQLRPRGPRADIAAIREGLLWIIELKCHMSLQLLEQALTWRDAGALWTSVAIPSLRRRVAGRHQWHSRVVDECLRHYGIGLIFIDGTQVTQPIPPKLLRYNFAKACRIRAGLDPRMQAYTPGSTSQAGFSGPSKRVVDDCLAYIQSHPGCSIKELVLAVPTPYFRSGKIRKYLLRLLLQHPMVIARQYRFDYFFYLATCD